MANVFRKWYDQRFHDEEAILLLLLLTAGVGLILFLGEILTPVIAALVLAFLCQGIVNQLVRYKTPHIIAVITAFLFLLLLEIASASVLSTLVLGQLDNFINELPKIIALLQERLAELPQKYPIAISDQQVEEWSNALNAQIAGFGQWVVAFSQSKIPNMLSFLVYLILVPVLVFFFLKDRDKILGWFGGLLPERRPLLKQVWNDMNAQMGNYVRGKFIEMFIVGAITYVVFIFFDLRYSALLAIAVGISVIVPYVGAFIVTIPVALVAYLQWGFGPDFAKVFIAYLIIQIIDGNLLVPWLFSEAVNLHPVAILLAIMFFGGIWGLWGVFFAIPLATLINAVLNAWPTLSTSNIQSQ
ncbi:MAG: AI-2E family transporter [Pseudomonadales bacterium]